MKDLEIVALYWKRDERAINETQKQYDRYLRKVAYNILADFEDSKEAINDTYLAAWNSMPKNSPRNLSTYLGKITRQISIDIFRKKNANKRYASQFALSLDELDECIPASSVEEVVDGFLLAESINNFLGALSETERTLFIGRYFYFDSIKKLAVYTDMKEEKTKSMLYRIRQRLMEYLDKEGFANE